MKINDLSNRQIFALIALITALSMSFALYLQYVVELAVCPLCFTQRVFVIGAGIIAAIAALHGPSSALGQRLYGVGILAMVAIGGGFAGRHVWLQHLPIDEVPACGPSVEYMLQTLPFSDTLTILLMGDGNCADVVWTFLGLSIPELTLAMFFALGISTLWLIFRAKKQ